MAELRNMLPALLLQLHEEASEAAQRGEEAAATAEPWLVEQVNHLFGPAVLALERAIMPPVYHLFGKTWHEPAAGTLVIPTHVVMALIVFIICTLGIWLVRGKLSVDRPSRRQQFFEIIVENIRGLLDQVIGPYGNRYVPVVGGFAIFIVVSNLLGLIPGLEAPTTSINVTGALGLSSFLYYMSRGFRQQGVGYLRHFMGGLTGWLLPFGVLIFFVEIVSNFVRPVTLSVRLFVNMYADHLIGSTFLSLTPWLVPIFTLVLAVFVSFVQTFIFIMLSMVYLSETVPHDDHDHEEHGHSAPAEAH